MMDPTGLGVRGLGILAVSAGVFFAGWAANGWRHDAAFAVERAELVEANTTLARAISEQNAKVEQLSREAELAKASRARAQREAQTAQRDLAARSDAVRRLEGTCDQVIDGGWGKL